MLSFFPNGTTQIKSDLCNCSHCSIGEFNQCSKVEFAADREEVLELDETEEIESEVFEFIESNSFVALYSTTKSFEQFYICHVTEKLIAENELIDIYGHKIQKGSKFLKAFYLEKTKEKRDKVFYKKLNKEVFIYSYEVFCPAVPIEPIDMSLSITEYRFHSDSV